MDQFKDGMEILWEIVRSLPDKLFDIFIAAVPLLMCGTGLCFIMGSSFQLDWLCRSRQFVYQEQHHGRKVARGMYLLMGIFWAGMGMQLVMTQVKEAVVAGMKESGYQTKP